MREGNVLKKVKKIKIEPLSKEDIYVNRILEVIKFIFRNLFWGIIILLVYAILIEIGESADILPISACLLIGCIIYNIQYYKMKK